MALKLCAGCRYNRLVGQNATSLSRRFTRLYGLQPLLLTELSAMDAARTASLTTLNTLAERCANVTQSFVDQVCSLACCVLCCPCCACLAVSDLLVALFCAMLGFAQPALTVELLSPAVLSAALPATLYAALRAVPGAAMPAMPGAALPVVPGAAMPAVPAMPFMPAMPAAVSPVVPGAAMPAMPGAALPAMPGAALRAMPGAAMPGAAMPAEPVVAH